MNYMSIASSSSTLKRKLCDLTYPRGWRWSFVYTLSAGGMGRLCWNVDVSALTALSGSYDDSLDFIKRCQFVFSGSFWCLLHYHVQCTAWCSVQHSTMSRQVYRSSKVNKVTVESLVACSTLYCWTERRSLIEPTWMLSLSWHFTYFGYFDIANGIDLSCIQLTVVALVCKYCFAVVIWNIR